VILPVADVGVAGVDDPRHSSSPRLAGRT
jgi:hypothetical protein